jgi:hypothetical protein
MKAQLSPRARVPRGTTSVPFAIISGELRVNIPLGFHSC